ncbi:MAG: BadF/BadG/BcrA/BcrD ATPase family protein, partial [Desulfobacterales bacterium]
AARVVAMARRLGLKPPIMMTGGVAKNIGVVKALERKMGQKMIVSPKAQIIGAIGAALIGQNA